MILMQFPSKLPCVGVKEVAVKREEAGEAGADAGAEAGGQGAEAPKEGCVRLPTLGPCTIAYACASVGVRLAIMRGAPNGEREQARGQAHRA